MDYLECSSGAIRVKGGGREEHFFAVPSSLQLVPLTCSCSD